MILRTRSFMPSAMLFGIVTASCVACATDAAFAQFTITRFTVDGGGGRSVGGTFALGGTIGQPDAGRLSGSTFTLSGGFWAGGATATAVSDGAPGDGGDLPSSAPLVFQLYAATPNPVAQRTLIRFDLPAPSSVRATLYDASGRLVRSLVDEALPAGRHQRAWDRRDAGGRLVPSGIYFLRLEAGPNESRQKIVVVS